MILPRTGAPNATLWTRQVRRYAHAAANQAGSVAFAFSAIAPAAALFLGDQPGFRAVGRLKGGQACRRQCDREDQSRQGPP